MRPESAGWELCCTGTGAGGAFGVSVVMAVSQSMRGGEIKTRLARNVCTLRKGYVINPVSQIRPGGSEHSKQTLRPSQLL